MASTAFISLFIPVSWMNRAGSSAFIAGSISPWAWPSRGRSTKLGIENGFNPGPELCQGGIAGAKLADGADAHAVHGPLIGAPMSTRHDFVFAAQPPKHEGFTHQYF
jgi:hypothetical protein